MRLINVPLWRTGNMKPKNCFRKYLVLFLFSVQISEDIVTYYIKYIYIDFLVQKIPRCRDSFIHVWTGGQITSSMLHITNIQKGKNLSLGSLAPEPAYLIWKHICLLKIRYLVQISYLMVHIHLVFCPEQHQESNECIPPFLHILRTAWCMGHLCLARLVVQL